MARAPARTQRTLRVQRRFERSRLEDDLVAAAYQLAVPVPRRSQRRPDPKASLPASQPRSSGGFSA